MIFGIGTDLVDTRRIEGVSQRYGTRFWRRILNDGEGGGSFDDRRPLVLAKRFAAKEACAKALGTGISRELSWHDMTILHGAGRPPQILLSPSALRIIQEKIGESYLIKLDLSLSDEYPYVQAFVVISYKQRSTFHGSD